MLRWVAVRFVPDITPPGRPGPPGRRAALDCADRRAASEARASLRSKRPDIIDAAVEHALRETVFCFKPMRPTAMT